MGIFKESMGARNRGGIGLSYREPVFVDLLRRPEIDSQPGEIDSSESIPGLHKCLQIRAPARQATWAGGIHALESILVLHKTQCVFVDVYGHLGIDSKNRFRMKN